MAGFGLTSDYTSKPAFKKRKSWEIDNEAKEEFRVFKEEMQTEWVSKRKWKKQDPEQAEKSEFTQIKKGIYLDTSGDVDSFGMICPGFHVFVPEIS